jgi:3-oxoadipate enol-lactonase
VGFEQVAVGGAVPAARTCGEEELPWIVLSNSLGTTSAMWAPQIPLIALGRRVLSYNTRGHG